MVSIQKKGAVYGVIALMLCVAVYLNWSYVKTPDELVVAEQADGAGDADSVAVDGTADNAAGTAEVIAEEDYFAQSRLSRQQARDEAIGILKGAVENESTDDKMKQESEEKISAMAENAVQEASMESLIKAKGYTEAVVFIGEESVNVVVQPPEGGLQATDVSKIKDIILAETSASAEQIKIVEAA